MDTAIFFPTNRQATRYTGGRSKEHSTGSYVTTLPGDPEPFIFDFESKLEHRVGSTVFARNDVKHYWDQSPPIQVECPGRQPRKRQPDALFERKDGWKSLLYIKPEEKIASGRYDEDIELISRSLSSDYADELVVVTDASFEPWEATNAERLMGFRRTPDEEADEIVAEFASRLDGLITIGDLIVILQIGGRGFRAIFRAIYDGVLKQIEDGIIDLTTVVEAGDAK